MGGSAPAAAQVDYGPMLAMITMMNQQNEETQLKAQEAQDKSLFNTSARAAEQAGQQSMQQAQQQAGLADLTQQAKDAAALDAYTKGMAGQGSAATGGAYDINAVNKLMQQNLGAVASDLPSSPYNIGLTKSVSSNPAATTAGLAQKQSTANQFGMPNMSNINLGGY